MLLAVVLTLLLAAIAAVSAMRFDHTAQLTDDFRLLWTMGREDMIFEMQVRTHGYIGLGFARSSDSREAGADAIIGWVDKRTPYFQDRHLNEHFEPKVDDSQDYVLLKAYENATHTVMRFVRNLDTCDPLQDVRIVNDTMRLIVIYHAEQPRNGRVRLPGALSDSQMAIRAVVPLQLSGRTRKPLRPPANRVQTIDVLSRAVPMPRLPGERGDGATTLEWCRMLELNQFKQKHHMIGFQPVFASARARKQLDAIVLYECAGAASALTAAERSGGAVCALWRQTHAVVCEAVVASWTRGSAGLHFPSEAGYPFDSRKERFYLMESHYSAGSLDAVVPADLAREFRSQPVLDNSGLRLRVTTMLRPYDAGVLSIGMSPDWRHIIPPGQLNVISEGHCVDECTRRALPADGIEIFAVTMQTHTIGKQVRLRQVRQETELPPIATDAGVHETYAEYRRITPLVRVLPGDNLIVECTYDSSTREAITLGSASARRGESCQVLAVYYPRQKRMTRCHSLPSLPTVLHSLGIDELADGSQPVLIAAPPALAGMTLESRLVSYNWSAQFEAFQRVTRTGSFEAICMNARHKTVTGTDVSVFHRPRTTQSLEQTSPPAGYVCEKWPSAVDGRLRMGSYGITDELRRFSVDESVDEPDEPEVESMGLSGAERSSRAEAVIVALVAGLVAAMLRT